MRKQIDGPINQKALIAYSQGNPTYAKALKLTVKLFEKDKRPFTGLKYASHAMTVATVLLDVRADLKTMTVSALQDVLKKSSVTEESIAADYGDDVLALVKALQPGEDQDAHIAALVDADVIVHTVLAASLLDEVCSVPRKVVKTPEAQAIFARAAAYTPALTKANPEVLRRLSVVVKNITAQFFG